MRHDKGEGNANVRRKLETWGSISLSPFYSLMSCEKMPIYSYCGIVDASGTGAKVYSDPADQLPLITQP